MVALITKLIIKTACISKMVCYNYNNYAPAERATKTASKSSDSDLHGRVQGPQDRICPEKIPKKMASP